MSKVKWLITVIGISGVAALTVAQSGVNGVGVDDPTQAEEAALAIIGVDSRTAARSALSTSTSRIQLKDTSNPLLWNTESPIDSWEVTIGGFTVGDSELCARKRSCTIRLAASTGSLISATIIDSGVENTMPTGSGEYYERRLNSSSQKIVGFSSVPPPVVLSDALLVPTLSAPCKAEEIVVWCIVMEIGNGPARPYWCIVGKSVPFLDLSGEHTDDHGQTPLVNYMSIVDAETGEAMSSERVR